MQATALLSEWISKGEIVSKLDNENGVHEDIK